MDKNRLLWGSRRGMLELDLILAPFVENGYDDLNDEDKLLFQQLLECEDQDMFGWFIHRFEPEDPDMQRIVHLVRASRQKPR